MSSNQLVGWLDADSKLKGVSATAYSVFCA